MKTLFCFVCVLLLIGDVSQAGVNATQRGTTLTIKGDGAGDRVDVLGFGSGVLEVHVNFGWPSAFSNVKEIRIDLGDGSDFLNCDGVRIDGNMTINLGGDSGDYCVCSGVTISKNLTIQGASDNKFFRSYVGRNMTLSASQAFDIDWNGFTQYIEDSQIDGRTTVNGSSGDDYVKITTSNFGSRTIKLGAGNDSALLDRNDVFGTQSTDGGQGFDTIQDSDTMVLGRTTRRNWEVEIF